MMRLQRVLALAALAACARGMQAQAGTGGDLPPAGYGTLNQGDLNLRFGVADLEVRFLPLDERILRLLGPDAYASLHGLVQARQAALDSIAQGSGTSTPGYALVSFFALRPDAPYDPDNLALFIRNRFYRPVGILPFTGDFNARRLDVRQSATAIYVFESPIPVYEEFQVVYGPRTSDGWRDVLPRIERERARVMARAAADTTRKP
ncbi:MAG TPA: hypothetical protein VNJ71_02205 [Gemmatimonadales bacterium]|jgi:hypothetical protein|nr:hypothetical protein [Gemmatimonadales bacterium]